GTKEGALCSTDTQPTQETCPLWIKRAGLLGLTDVFDDGNGELVSGRSHRVCDQMRPYGTPSTKINRTVKKKP
ncbi:hypothetical protein ACFL6S_33535, partial [Candidatus Poribacteria bacterium]